jgi:hypothetical protein
MLSKTGTTTIITLIAASSFAGASMVPAVAQATKNTGAYKKSSEAMKVRPYTGTCAQAGRQFSAYEEQAELAEGKGETKVAAEERDMANKTYDAGAAKGCWPAVRLSPPTPAPVHVTALP